MDRKIKSFEDFSRLREKLKSSDIETQNYVTIRVAMATCGIASGAREIERFLKTELPKRNIDAIVIPVGCMSYCYAEPTIEVTVPGKDPIVFGFVDLKKADEIIESYIKNDHIPAGVIPVNYDLA